MHCLITGHEHFEHVLLLSGQTKTLLAIYIHSSPERTSPRLPHDTLLPPERTRPHHACLAPRQHTRPKLTSPAKPLVTIRQLNLPLLPRRNTLRLTPPYMNLPSLPHQSTTFQSLPVLDLTYHACLTNPRFTTTYPTLPHLPHLS